MKNRLLLLTTASVLGGAGFSQATPVLRITEAMSNGDTADWFEVTNYGDTAANITNHRMDDGSFAVGNSVALAGVTSIAPGESVVFVEGDATIATTLKTNWSLPAVQVGYYSGSGVGLGSSSDGITLFDNDSANSGVELAGPFSGLIRVSFGAATPGTTFNWAYDGSGNISSPVGGQLTQHGTTWINGATMMLGTPGTVPSAFVDLSKYVRVGRFDLPEPTRTSPPSGSLLAQEASGVAYNWDTDTLFIVGDGGTSVTEVTKTGALVSSMTLPPGGSPQGTEFFDTEGITYVGGGQFVMTEERDRQAVKFTYVAGGTLARAAAQTVKLGTSIISEVAPWSSGNSPVAADWFEVSNTGSVAVDITGWKVDDSSNDFTKALALTGVTSIAPGESVIFIESDTPATTVASFRSTWFGTTPPPSLQIGTYTGSGIGLSSNADAVNLFDASGNLKAGVSFGASPTAQPFATFDNAAGINGAAISLLSVAGVNHAFAADSGGEIGSPGDIDFTPSAVNVAAGFTTWLSQQGYTSDGLDADSDGDGLTDRVEFFFGVNPNSRVNGNNLPAVVLNGADRELHFGRLTAAAGVDATLHYSSDLQGAWPQAVEGVDYEIVSETPDGGQTDVIYHLLGAGNARFFRFEVK